MSLKPFSLRRRASGLLLPLFSLPGPHGIGDLGPGARRFVDFLAETGQGWWQMLPVGPTNESNSPYQALSSFKGNPLLISLEDLVRDGLLKAADLRRPAGLSGPRVRYEAVRRFKGALFKKAFDRSGRGEDRDTFLQGLFERQWKAFRAYAQGRGVGLLGDVPLFVAHDSEDVRSDPEIFQLDPKGRMALQAGVPPDYFSRTGQLWGSPHYRWEVLKKTGYEWWIRRLEWTFRKFDAVRLDHFIGFYRAWAVPGKARTAVRGRWLRGPGADFFKTVFDKLGRLELIAEDLGRLVPGVKALRDAFDLPGMRVLQFAFGGDAEADNYLPHNYPRRCVAYTGTHDNNTSAGWFRDDASPAERAFALRYLKSDGREIPWDMVRAVFESKADLAVVPLQDVLGLGPEARINRPGTIGGNWEWRLDERLLTTGIAQRLLHLTETSRRSSRNEIPPATLSRDPG